MGKRYALVTGCSEGGIGYALAAEFHKRGLHVFATARTLSKLGSLANLPNIHPLAIDVTSTASIKAAVDAVRTETGGRLDYLVNNSGIVTIEPLLDAKIEAAKTEFDVNVWGFLAMTQAFAPLVIEAKGSVVNIASIVALIEQPWMGIYTSSKAAMEVMSETLRHELAPFGVKVITSITGGVQTKGLGKIPPAAETLPAGSIYRPALAEIDQSAKPKGEFCLPEAFARKLVGDALGGASGRVYRGSFSTVSKYLSAWSPQWLLDKVVLNGAGMEKLSQAKDQ